MVMQIKRYEKLTARVSELIRSRFLRSLGWMGGAQLAMRLSRLAATVVLSRALAPNDYGLAAIVLTVYECVALFSRSGVVAAVVKAEDEALADVAHNSWLFTIGICVLLAGVQGLIALPVALWRHDMRLVAPIVLMGLIFLVGPFSTIQFAMLQRQGRFRRIAAVGGAQVIIDNLLTGGLALAGFGMWAIVLPKVLVAPIWLVGIRYGHPWRPDAVRRFRLRGGWRSITRFMKSVIGVEMLLTLQGNVDNLIVAGVLGVQALGVYYFAYNAGLGIMLGLMGSMGVAVYPHLCESLGDRAELRARYFQSLRTLAWITAPVILAQVLLAPWYVPLVFSAKWTPAVPVLMLICLSALLRPYAGVCSSLLRAVGRPDLELRWQAVLTAALVVGLFIGTLGGILGVAAAVCLVQTFVLAAYCWFAPRRFLRAEDPAPAADQPQIDLPLAA